MTRATRILSVLPALLLGVFVMSTAHAWAQAGPSGSSLQIFSGGPRWPAVAYDQANRVYLVVFGASGIIRGRFMNDDGTPNGAVFNISTGNFAQTPRAAYSPDAGGFLVTWHSTEQERPVARAAVRARMVAYPGGAAGVGTILSSDVYSSRWEIAPAVAYATGSRKFMVSWARYSVGGGEVSACFVDNSANRIGSEISLSTGAADYERDPAVGYLPGADRFFVAWSAYSEAGGYSMGRGQLFNAAAGSAASSVVQFAQAQLVYVPELTLNTATGKLFLTWIQTDTGGLHPFGNHLDGNGVFVSSSPTRLSATVGSYDANSVDYNVRTATYFLVTQPPGTVLLQDYGVEISGAGAPLATAAKVTNIPEVSGYTGAFNPRLAASTQEARWIIATVGAFTSVWTQLIGGNATQPPPDPPPGSGGGGGGTYSLAISPSPAGGSVSGGGLLCGSAGSTCTVTPSSATTLTISAIPDTGYAFSGWSGACSGTNPTVNVTVDGARTCSAIFAWAGGGPPPGCLAAPAPSFPAASGPIGSSVKMFDGVARWPDVAYDPCRQVYLTVWGSGGKIRGRFVSDDQTASGSAFDISTGAFAQTPRVAYSPDTGGFLVTWHSTEQVTPTARAAVRAGIVTYPGGTPVAGTILSADSYSSRWEIGASVAYATSSRRFMVSWGRYSTGSGEVHARLVDNAGTALGSEIVLSSGTADYERDPAVGYFPDTDRFFVAWSAYNEAGAYSQGRGQFLAAATGAPVGSTLVFAQSQYVYVPEVALNTVTGQLLLAWIQNGPGGWRPYGRILKSDGTWPSASGSLLSSTVGAYDANSVAFNPLSKSFYLVTHGATLQDWGFEISGTGAAVGTAAAVTSIPESTGYTGGFNPRLASSTLQPRWLIDTAGSFNTLWTQLVGGVQSGTGSPVYQIAISPAPSGGTVSGGGLACGAGGAVCQVTFPNSTTVTLTATPASGYVFTNWGGACSGTSAGTSVLVDAAKTCTAVFTATGGGTTYQLSISPTPANGRVSGSGISCGTGGSACQMTVPASTSVTLTAAADSGYAFTGWGGNCAGTSPTVNVTVDAAKTCSATFAAGLPTGPPYTMTISPKPAGGRIQGAGINCGTTGTMCAVTMPASMSIGIEAVPDAGYKLGAWTGDCSGTSAGIYVPLTGARTCGAIFSPIGTLYQLNVSPVPTGGTVSGGGLGCGSTGGACQVSYANIASITVTAVPDSGNVFSGWGGSCGGTNASTTVYVDGVRTCTATFAAAPVYQLTIGPAPTGGTVNGGGISCGVSGSTCQQTYGASTPVTLTAAPAAGYTFTGWGGSCSGTNVSTTVQVNAVRTCSATFTPGAISGPPYALTIARPTGGSVQGAGLNCGDGGALCSVTMPASMTIGITATASTGHTFTGWTGDCSGTASSIWVNLNGPRTCGATFTSNTAPTYRLTISPAPTGGAVTGNGLNCGAGGATCLVAFGSATTATITATPAAGYTFSTWGGACSGTSATTTVQVDTIRTCSATFASASAPPTGPPYTLSITQPAGGKVTGAGLNCGAGGTLCTVTMPAAMTIGISAAASAGYTFSGWTGNCSGTTSGLWVALNGPRSCGATFTPTGGGSLP